MGITQKEFTHNAGISSPRYLRKILKGERSGRILEQRAEIGGAFTVPIEYGKEIGGINIRLPAGVSRIDVFQPKVQKAIAKEVRKAQREERSALTKKPSQKVTDSEEARIRGKVRANRLRFARVLRRMPRVVIP